MAQWMRDAFWTTMSIPDSAICNGIFQIFYNIVDWADGLCGSIFKDDDVTVWDRAFDDSLPLFLVWAYWLNLKFGLTLLTTSELNILAGSIKNNISTFGRYRNYMKTGVIKLVNSFDDGLFPGTTYGETAYNQGWCWVALKSAQALGATVSAGDLTAAQNAYKGFFHQADQHISMAVIDGTDLNLVGSMDLIPEAWAQMLFGTSVLGSTIVAAQWNILQSGKILDGFKCTAHVNGAFVTEAIWRGYGSTPATSPKGGGQNGAIWFMLDFCCIYAAKFNGVISSSTATALYNARVSRELALLPSFQEYLLTDSEAITTNYNGGTWYNLGLGASASPIYGWNAAVLSFLPSFLAADSTTTTTTTTGSPTSSTTTTTGSPTTTTTSAPTTTTHAPTTTTTTAAPFMTPSFLVQPYQSGAVGGSVTISFWITGSAGDTFSIYDENPIFGDGGYAQATGVLPNQLQSITIGGVGSPYSTDWLRAISEHTGRSADSSTYSAAPGTTTTTTTTTAAPTTSTTSTTSGPTTTTTTTAGPTTNTTTSAPLLAPILSATAGPGRVTVSWPSVSGALSYNIYATADGSAPTLASAKQAGVTSPRVYSGLNPAVVYKYAATSVNSSGVESALGSVVSATPFAATTTTTPSSFPLAINVGGQILRFAETPGGALRIVIAGQVLQFALGDAGAVKVVTPQGTKCLN